MKLSTFGFGIAFFLFAIVSGTWIFSEGTYRGSAPERPVAVLESSDGTNPDYLVRGQSPNEPADASALPPAKLTYGATRKGNPLRNPPAANEPIQQATDLVDNDAERRPVIRPVTLSAPDSVPRNDTDSSTHGSAFDVAPSTFGAPQDNFLESAGFPDEPSPQTLAPRPSNHSDPKPLFQVDAATEEETSRLPDTRRASTPQPARPLSPDTLGGADPFATKTQPLPVAPMVESTPEPRISRGVPPNTQNTSDFAYVHEQTPSRTPSITPYRNMAAEMENEGTGTPGPSVLEGTQTPHLTLEKILPAEIVLNQPATIKTVIRNVGRSPARDVTVRDRIPQGTRLLSTSPQANVTPENELLWPLGHLDGNEQLTVEMRVLPIREVEIGSVAEVRYSAEASGRKMVTRPKLQVEVKAPQEIRLGQVANIEITISNPGSATARGIVLEEYVPDGLYHKDGKVLVNKNVDTLKPKEAKKLVLALTCTGSGLLVNRVVVKADGDLMEEDKTTIRALSPILNLEIAGSKQHFLERRSAYRLIVSNTGTASAEDVDLVMKLPTAAQFVSTNQSGIYEPSTHTVHWALEELPPQEAGEIELVLMPAKIGNYSLAFTGNGQNDLKAETALPMVIDGIAATSFDVVAPSLVELGKEAVYEIRVSNKGTKKSSNVRIRAGLSDGLSFVNADAPVRHQSQGGIVQFEPLTQLDPKGEKVYKITAKCMSDGDHRINIQLMTDELSSPITKEESTRIFQ